VTLEELQHRHDLVVENACCHSLFIAVRHEVEYVSARSIFDEFILVGIPQQLRVFTTFYHFRSVQDLWRANEFITATLVSESGDG
jgi:hypothetical protein